MNYNNLYKAIIKNYGVQDKPTGFYAERHHIKPKCIGGTNDATNLTYVPARVHFILHRILCKVYPNEHKLAFAFWAMCNQLHGDVTREYKVTSRVFDTARKGFAIANSELHSGKTISEEHRKRLSIVMKGNTYAGKGKDNSNYGKPRSDNVRDSIRETKLANPTKNGQFKGYYVTPFGKFANVRLASEVTGFNQTMIRRYCNNPDKVVTTPMLNQSEFLISEHVGKLLSELGWGFEPIEI